MDFSLTEFEVVAAIDSRSTVFPATFFEKLNRVLFAIAGFETTAKVFLNFDALH